MLFIQYSVSLLLGAGCAVVLVGAFRLFDRLTNYILAIGASLLCAIMSTLFAFGLPLEPSPTEQELFAYRVGIWFFAGAALGSVAFFILLLRARLRASAQEGQQSDGAAQAVPPTRLEWRRAALGVASAMGLGYGLIVLPMTVLYALTGRADRGLLDFAVLGVVVHAVPMLAMIALSFIPAFILFEWRGWRGPTAYVTWGTALLVIIASEMAEESFYLASLAIGPAEGFAFWLGARGPLATWFFARIARH